ncbi:secreted antigen 1 [Babesia divergens]|uniref:Secreted antigen 1 n=1 Tax=Babesia divergens TaxID=32595 RepID=A0AAD9G9L0_BABDI|nr:secreted antigen 1 [Babesia divergens]
MKLLGILRASALCLLVSAFYGQPVSCGLFNRILSSKKPSNAKVSENLKESPVKSQVAENLKDSNVESPLVEKPSQESSSTSSAPAPKSNLVFENATWDDSMLASTFLFIEEFCSLVNAEKFKGKLSNDIYEDLSKKCANLSSYVGSFIHRFKPTYGPGTVTERKEIPMNFYKDVLKAEDFKLYAKWIVKNIPSAILSFKFMSIEYFYLTEEQLKTETKVGPFIYGFVYTGKPWGELSHGTPRGFFGSNTILESFKDLKSSLDDILGNSITSKVFSLFSREKKSDVNSQQENSTVKSKAA